MKNRATIGLTIAAAIVCTVGACAAYLWVLAIGVTSTQGRYESPWINYPVGPAVAVFVPTMAVLLAAMIHLWSIGRRRPWSTTLWVAGLLTWCALASNFVVWAVEATDPLGGWTSWFWQLSELTIALAPIVAIVGIGLLCAEYVRRHRSARS